MKGTARKGLLKKFDKPYGIMIQLYYNPNETRHYSSAYRP